MTNYETLNNAIKKLDTFVKYHEENWRPVPLADINHDKKIMLDYIKKGLVITWRESNNGTETIYFLTSICFKTRKVKYKINDMDLIDREITETNVKFNKSQLELVPTNAVIKDVVI